jgi:hypothetical protein
MRCGSAVLPDGSVLSGRVTDPAAVGHAIRQLVARTEITESRALVAINDSVATFRVLNLPAATTDQAVGSAVANELPLDPARITIRWTDVGPAPEPALSRAIYAVASDRANLKAVVEAVKAGGVEAQVVELKSASLARTVAVSSCIIVDLTGSPGEIVLVDRHLPQVWHGFEVKHPLTDDVVEALAPPLRSAIRFYLRNRAGSFDSNSPILISAEQVFPSQAISELSKLVNQPVQLLPAPPRVAPNVRHSTYLACLGLIMRRS